MELMLTIELVGAVKYMIIIIIIFIVGAVKYESIIIIVIIILVEFVGRSSKIHHLCHQKIFELWI